LPSAAPGKGFAECKVAFAGCIRHPAKRLNPVVKVVEMVDRAVSQAEVETIDEVLLIGGSTMIPKVRELIRDYFGGTKAVLHSRLKPDEVVTIGAAEYSKRHDALCT